MVESKAVKSIVNTDWRHDMAMVGVFSHIDDQKMTFAMAQIRDGLINDTPIGDLEKQLTSLEVLGDTKPFYGFLRFEKMSLLIREYGYHPEIWDDRIMAFEDSLMK